MKPNDKAIEAGVKLCWDCPRATPSMIRDILEAAYAAQFQREDYAELIKMLRSMHKQITSAIEKADPWGITDETVPGKAADAIEAVLAERDALKAENESMAQNLPLWAHKQMAANNAIIERLRAERDALLARLAPVDDEELVEIAAKRMCINDDDDEELIWSNATHTQKEYYLTQARAAITAIRPHIEAAERERCARIVDERYWDANQSDGHIEGWNGAVKTITAAIRSGK